MQQINKAHTDRLLNLAQSLNVPVEEFFKPTNESAKLNVLARAFILLDSYVTGDDVNLSDRDLLTIIADRIKDDKPQQIPTKKYPQKGEKAFSLEDGEGTIMSVHEYSVIVYFGSNDEAAAADVGFSELEWNDAEGRWEYGDLARK